MGLLYGLVLTDLDLVNISFPLLDMSNLSYGSIHVLVFLVGYIYAPKSLLNLLTLLTKHPRLLQRVLGILYGDHTLYLSLHKLLLGLFYLLLFQSQHM